MANLSLFQSLKRKLGATDTTNHAGAPAYQLTARHQLAQLAATGCLTTTFYTSQEDQLGATLALANQVEPEFVAKTAIYARTAGHMKDMPALLATVLAVRDVALLTKVFDRVIDDGKMLRNFVQIIRSGTSGRKSLGSRPKKLVQAWLCRATEKQLLHASIGNNPSLADVVKMVHPKPQEPWREAWFAWLLGRPYEASALPPITLSYLQFSRAAASGDIAEIPDVPFQMLSALKLDANAWAQIARKGSWQMVRQNLNTFARHGVFAIAEMAEVIAAKLRDPQAIAKARVLPYQLMMAYLSVDNNVPFVVKEALQDAMELALTNVPVFAGTVVVCPDVSGSMRSPATGQRGAATSQVRCIDVAALVAAAVLRKNSSARVLPFEQQVVKLQLNPRDSVMTNAKQLAAIGGGGTNCSAPLAQLNQERAKADVVILVSDNESWIDARRAGATQTMAEWETFKTRNPKALLVCIDVQPYHTTQALERADIMNVGGFSDAVFTQIERFTNSGGRREKWLTQIENISLTN